MPKNFDDLYDEDILADDEAEINLDDFDDEFDGYDDIDIEFAEAWDSYFGFEENDDEDN